MRHRIGDRICKALEGGPLYLPALALIVARSQADVRSALVRLVAAGKVEQAHDIGPATYRLRGQGDA